MPEQITKKQGNQIIRKPIVTILGHVDHGKTTLLDTIRDTTVTEREAGKITQAIGASIIPSETITRICGSLLKKLNIKLTIPGLLFIDTPGHAAFTNLRKRGGNLADIAILVVDINEGLMPQTIEAIEILKRYKTPFVVAANKIDLINGWKKQNDSLLESINKQQEETKKNLEKKHYELVGKLHEQGFSSERFDRIEDHTKQIAIVPLSAKTGEGIAELLMVVSGLTQKFLQENLRCDVTGQGKGTILEVKEEKGLGITVDAIIYDGTIKVNDTIIIAGLEKPIVTRVKALFEPMPLAEMRDKKSKFKNVKQVYAAAGVKISAPELDGVVAGMPLAALTKDKEIEDAKEEIQKEIEEVLIETDKEGIVIKADTIGSLEALITLLKEKNITIRKATIGSISKKDIIDAEGNIKEPLNLVILGFNAAVGKDAEEYSHESKVTVLTNDVIYRLIEEYEKWMEEKKKKIEIQGMEKLTRGAKFQILPNHTFRQSHPAIVGVDVMAGILKTGAYLMNKEGTILTSVKSMKSGEENISEIKAGKQLAVAMDGVTVGRQINEGDVLYVAVPEEDFRELKKYKKHLSKDEIEVLKEIAAIMRKKNPTWGI